MPNNYSVSKAANFLGVSTKTMRRWETSGRLNPKRTKGGHRRYRQTDLNLFQNTRLRQVSGTPSLNRVPVLPSRFIWSTIIAAVFLLSFLPQTIFGRMLGNRLVSWVKDSGATKTIREILLSDAGAAKNREQKTKNKEQRTKNSEQSNQVLGEENIALPSAFSLRPSSLLIIGGNLLKNHSFEAANGQQPIFWEYHPNSTQDNTSRTTLVNHSGEYSLMLNLATGDLPRGKAGKRPVTWEYYKKLSRLQAGKVRMLVYPS